MKTSIIFGLALLVFFSSIAHAQPMPDICDASSITNYWSLRFGSWQDLCAIGILTSFLIISVIYMLSQAFGKPDLTAWCRKELFQVFITMIIFAGIFGFVNLTCTTVKPSLLINLDENGDGIPDYPDDMFQYDIAYLQWLRDASYRFYVWTATFNSIVSFKVTEGVYQSPGGFGVNLKPFSGLSPVSGMLSFSMSTMLIGGFVTTVAQLRMLRVIQIMMFNIILPLGLVCRCFEPSRTFGGGMMAIAIGLFLFYPFLLMLNAGIIHENLLTKTAMDTAFDTGVGGILSTYQDELSLGTAGEEYNQVQNPGFLDPATGPGYAKMSIFNSVFNLLYDIFLKIILATLFLLLFNFIMLITFVRALSRILGEEVDVTNITRMI